MAGHADHRERVKLRVKDRERLREIIRVEDLINRVQGFALATRTELMDEIDLAMMGDQLSAARMMLAKVLPDLASVEITPDPEAVQVLDTPMTAEAWATAHAGDGETMQ